MNKILSNNKAGDILTFSIIKYETDREIYVIDLKTTNVYLNENAKSYIPQIIKEKVTNGGYISNNNENKIWNLSNTCNSINIPLNGNSLLNNSTNSIIKPNINETHTVYVKKFPTNEKSIMLNTLSKYEESNKASNINEMNKVYMRKSPTNEKCNQSNSLPFNEESNNSIIKQITKLSLVNANKYYIKHIESDK